MWRHLAVVTIAWLAMTAVAAAGAVKPAGAPAKRHVVGFAQDTMANDWRATQVHELQHAFAAEADIDFVFTDAQGDSARQVQDIESLARRGVDVLLTSPRDAELMRAPIARIQRQGIPVILLSRRVNGDAFTQLITADNRAIARQAARYLAKRLNGQGRILVLQGVPTTSSAIDRTEGFLQELAHWPGLKVVAIKPADYLRAEAIRRVEETLAEKLAFDAIYSQSDSMALGAIMALKKAGIDPRRIPITGIDYIAEARAAIRAGELDASFTYPTFGREGAAAAIRLIRGGKPERKEIFIESVTVTRDNADTVEPIF
jgi:ribose transport system substrate-binding protein